MAAGATILTFDQHCGMDGRPQSTEAALVELARSGDLDAFDLLMRAHQSQVFRTAWRLLGTREDAQDAAQEVFLRFYRYLDGFDTVRSLAPWLYRVTVNVCRDMARRRRRRRAVSLEDAAATGQLDSRDPAPDPAAAAVLGEEIHIVEEALGTLSERAREALVLRDIEGLSTAEVASAMGSSESTVRSHICRARLKIREYRDRKMKGTSS
jgi:RNA polymerase sigma-70 factor (ECF subfamily)